MLRARDLSSAPPGSAAPCVRDFALDLERGEWLSVRGPNGSGKTTLALTLAGLWPALSGSVELDGGAIGPSRPSRARIAAVLQDPPSEILQSRVTDEIAFRGP